MSRPTPTISLTKEEAAALQTIVQNNRKDSIPYKRAAVVLACAEGKQGKEIAKQYEVSQNQVIKLRRKFVDGGVEGLLSNAKKGECVEMVRDALATTPPDNAESWTVSTLVKHLNIEHTSVRNALEKLDITLPENGHVVEHTFPDLKEKRVHIIGVFLSLTVQILALVISPSTDKSLFAEGKRITTTFGSAQSQEQAKDDGLGIDLVVALLSHSALPPSGNADKKTQEAAGFVRNLQDSLQKTGSQLYLIVNAPNPSSIVSDPPSIGMTLTSTEDFKCVASQWFQAIGESSPIATRLSSGVNRLLEQSSSCSAPFIWQVSQEGHQAYRPAAVSSAQPQTAGGNSVTFTLEFKDSSGAAITSSNVLINAVQNSGDFGQCKTVQGFQNLIGDLEQGLIKGTQDLARDFMGKVINAGSASADSEVHQKKRNNRS
ncbi:MAG: helix-turn-helix domain-containing protein [Desulfovibrionaceae bacterium]|nr:helix-turn-helix domain-containing protein [Desulfovibrionaceae bacterium]